MSNVIIFSECHWFSSFTRNAGTYRIATELRKNGFSVQVIDFFGFMTQRDIINITDKFVDNETLAICFSSTFFSKSDDNIYFSRDVDAYKLLQDRNDALNNSSEIERVNIMYPFSDTIIENMINIFKSKNNKIKVVYGGAKAKTPIAKHVDCFIVDFGEEAIIDYLMKIRLNNLTGIDKPLPTIYQYNKDKDEFDFVHSEIVWDKSDLVFKNEVLPIEISRGCIFKCKFCNYILIGRKGNDYIKTNSALREEFIRNYNEHGTTKYIFCDDTFNDNTDKLIELANISESLPFELEAAAYICPELVNRFPEQLELLRTIGLRFAKFGVESINPETRKFIGKGLPMEKMTDILTTIKGHWKDEVITSGSFIFGLPKETPETLQKQYSWIEKHALDVMHGMSIFPLHIQFSAYKSIKQSDIDCNYEKYGYQQLGNFNWYHPELGTTFEELKGVVNKLSNIIKNDPRNRHSGFSGMMIQNSGISFNDISTKSFNELNYDSANREYARKIQEYKRKLLS